MANRSPGHEHIVLLAGEREEGESNRALLACNEFLRMGVHRKLAKLVPLGYASGTAGTWAAKYGWHERAALYDQAIEQERNEEVARNRREVFEEGLGYDFERVRKLKKLAGFLEEQIYELEEVPPSGNSKLDDFTEPDAEPGREPEPEATDQPPTRHYRNLWLRDYKSVGGVPYEIFKFNAAIMEQYRGLLDDIAREKGDRKLRVDQTSLSMSLTAEDLASAQRDIQSWWRDRFGDNAVVPTVAPGGSSDAGDS